MSDRRLWWLALMISLGLMLAVTVPWRDMLGHTHWSRVRWIPFVSRPARLTDVAGNLLLCMPLGASVAGLVSRRRVATAVVTALGLSIAVESLQLFSHYRFPSMSDVVCNVAGAAAAAAVVDSRRRVGQRTTRAKNPIT